MAHQYFIDLENAPEVGDQVALPAAEAAHAARVARLRPGESVQLSDGAGFGALGTATRVERGTVLIEIERTWKAPELRTQFVLVQALAKGDRDERAIEQSTEFGVDTCVPWQAARSVSRWDGNAKRERGRARWESIARQASKQSMRLRIPNIEQVHTTAELCRAITCDADLSFVLHPGAEARLSERLREICGSAPASDDGRFPAVVWVVVGPEGGISPDERAAFAAAGAKEVALGDAVLRTSSAGPAALVLMNQAFGRW